MIECPNMEMRDRLPDLANESLEPAAMVLVTAHVEGCAACAAEVAIIRSTRLMMIHATPRVNVAGIVSALPQAGVRPIGSARSARGRSWGTWRAAAAITVLAAGLGGYAVLRPASPVRGFDSRIEGPAGTSDTDMGRGLALTGTLADLSDAELTALVKDIDEIVALPSADVETASLVTMPTILPDTIVRDLEIR